MKIFVDIDNTICHTEGTDYKNAKPYYEKINIINDLFDQGHEITYWTARGSGSGIDHSFLTMFQLKEWGAKYHELRFKKPVFDIFIDDKTINSIDKLGLWVQEQQKRS